MFNIQQVGSIPFWVNHIPESIEMKYKNKDIEVTATTSAFNKLALGANLEVASQAASSSSWIEVSSASGSISSWHKVDFEDEVETV